MSGFDPYRKWLGIPSEEQPPNFYRLLGISLDESDPEAIEAAAERQGTFVRKFRGTPHDEAAALILFEVDQAKHTLLNTEARKRYDASLHESPRTQRTGSADRVPSASGTTRGTTPPNATRIAKLAAGFLGVAMVIVALPWDRLFSSSQFDAAKVAPDLALASGDQAKPPAPLEDPVAENRPEPKQEPVPEPKPVDVPKAEPQRKVEPPKVAKLPREGVTLKGYKIPVMRLAFSEDGRKIVSGSLDGNVIVWDAETRILRTTFSQQRSGISALDFSPDGSTVASAAGDNTIRLFDATTGEERARFDQAGATTRVLFLPDGRTILSSHSDGKVRRWEIGRTISTATYDNGFAVRDMAIAPDGLTFASSAKGKVVIRDCGNGKVVSELPVEGEGVALSLAYFPNSQKIVGTIGNTREVMIWDVTTGKKVNSFGGEWNVPHTLAVHPSGDLVATSSTRFVGNGSVQEIKLFEVDTGRERRTLLDAAQKRPMLGFAFSPDGANIAVGREDGSIILLNVEE